MIVLFTICSFGPLTHQWVTVIAFEKADETMDGFLDCFFTPVILEAKYMYPDFYNPGHTKDLLAKDAVSKYRLLVLSLERD